MIDSLLTIIALLFSGAVIGVAILIAVIYMSIEK
jgi:hypothetical protein